MNNIVNIPAEPRPALMAGGRPTAIVPQSMDEAYRFAKAVCMAGMAPKGMDTPEKAMIAIMRGMEVGLTPFQALDKIAIVNGRPVIWGDGAMGLVRGSGACDWIRETISGEGDAMSATCQAKRKGEPEPIVGTFSVADAKKAGLWGKAGPWQQFPKRMLQMRARAFALRDGFADVLGGLYLKEEIEEAPTRQQPPTPHQTTSTAAAAAPRTLSPPNPNAPANTPLPLAQQHSKPFDFDKFRDALQSATTDDEANAIWDRDVEGHKPPLTGDELDEAQAMLREATQKFWQAVED